MYMRLSYLYRSKFFVNIVSAFGGTVQELRIAETSLLRSLAAISPTYAAAAAFVCAWYQP